MLNCSCNSLTDIVTKTSSRAIPHPRPLLPCKHPIHPTPRQSQMPNARPLYPAIATLFARSDYATATANIAAAADVGKRTTSSIGHISAHLRPEERLPRYDTTTHPMFPIDNASWEKTQKTLPRSSLKDKEGSKRKNAGNREARGLAATRW